MIAQKPGPCLGPTRTCSGRINPGDDIRRYKPSGRQRGGWAHYSCLSGSPSPTPKPYQPSTPVDPHTIRTYTYSEFIDKAATPRSTTYAHASRARTSDWNGYLSWDETISLAQSGWKDKTHTVQSLSESILTEIKPYTHEVFRTYNDVSGSEVDVGKYLSGEPECMIEYLPQQIAKPGRVITILVSGAFSSSVSADSIIRRGAAICALIEILEHLQHSTELYWEQTIEAQYSRSTLYTSLVKLKSASDHLDFPQTVFAICHPGMLRRICFSVEEQEPDSITRMCGFGPGNYGHPHSLTQASTINATITLNTMTMDQSPKDWIIDQLTKFGLIGDSQ